MTGFFLRALVFSVLVLCLPSLTLAGDDKLKSIEQEIEEIRERFQREQKRVSQLEEEIGELSKKRKRKSQQVEKVRGEQKVLLEKRDNLLTQIESLSRETERTAVQLERLRSSAEDRVQALYRSFRSYPAFQLLLSVTSAADLRRRGYYLKVIAEHDLDSLKKLLSLQKTQLITEAELENKRATLAEEIARIEVAATKAEREEFALAKLVSEMNAKSDEAALLTEELGGQLKLLEQSLASIMGAKDVPGPKVQPKRRVSNFASLKGQLDPPIKGQVVEKFGRSRHKRFGETVMVKGIEYRTEIGASVNVVADGRVVLSRVVPEFGNIIIVDHGDRYYSLYARLATSLVRVNEEVKRGDRIAVLGQPDKRGKNFYFELRYRGKAFDPGTYLKTLSR